MAEYCSYDAQGLACDADCREVPERILSVIALPNPDAEPQSFWGRHRATALAFVKSDHEAGGQGDAGYVERRRCKVGDRLLIGAQAHDYMEKVQLSKVR
jgi:hypothetical protein